MPAANRPGTPGGLSSKGSAARHMNDRSKDDAGGAGEKTGTRKTSVTPQDDGRWGDGLKKLYDSVVDEPLPDSFQDLLDRLEKE